MKTTTAQDGFEPRPIPKRWDETSLRDWLAPTHSLWAEITKAGWEAWKLHGRLMPEHHFNLDAIARANYVHSMLVGEAKKRVGDYGFSFVEHNSTKMFRLNDRLFAHFHKLDKSGLPKLNSTDHASGLANDASDYIWEKPHIVNVLVGYQLNLEETNIEDVRLVVMSDAKKVSYGWSIKPEFNSSPQTIEFSEPTQIPAPAAEKKSGPAVGLKKNRPQEEKGPQTG